MKKPDKINILSGFFRRSGENAAGDLGTMFGFSVFFWKKANKTRPIYPIF